MSNDTTAEKKGTKVIKAVGFTNWRSKLTDDDAVSFSNETIPQLDDCLLNFDWTTIADIEFSTNVLNDFPVNITFIHKHAREQFNITSPTTRLRIANNLSWIASRIMFQAAAFVKSQGRNRIMQAHIISAWGFVNSFFTEAKWVSSTTTKSAPAPATTKDKKANPTTTNEDVPEKETTTTVAKKRAPAKVKAPPVAKKAKTVSVQ